MAVSRDQDDCSRGKPWDHLRMNKICETYNALPSRMENYCMLIYIYIYICECQCLHMSQASNKATEHVRERMQPLYAKGETHICIAHNESTIYRKPTCMLNVRIMLEQLLDQVCITHVFCMICVSRGNYDHLPGFR